MGTQNQAGEIPSPVDEVLQSKMETIAAILINPNHPDRAHFDTIKSAVETRVQEAIAPVLEAIAASERITQDDLAVRINARS